MPARDIKFASRGSRQERRKNVYRLAVPLRFIAMEDAGKRGGKGKQEKWERRVVKEVLRLPSPEEEESKPLEMGNPFRRASNIFKRGRSGWMRYVSHWEDAPSIFMPPEESSS